MTHFASAGLTFLFLTLLFLFLSWVTESPGANPRNRTSDALAALSLLCLAASCSAFLYGIARLFGVF